MGINYNKPLDIRIPIFQQPVDSSRKVSEGAFFRGSLNFLSSPFLLSKILPPKKLIQHFIPRSLEVTFSLTHSPSPKKVTNSQNCWWPVNTFVCFEVPNCMGPWIYNPIASWVRGVSPHEKKHISEREAKGKSDGVFFTWNPKLAQMTGFLMDAW